MEELLLLQRNIKYEGMNVILSSFYHHVTHWFIEILNNLLRRLNLLTFLAKHHAMKANG
jgi:hypothetical protein